MIKYKILHPDEEKKIKAEEERKTKFKGGSVVAIDNNAKFPRTKEYLEEVTKEAKAQGFKVGANVVVTSSANQGVKKIKEFITDPTKTTGYTRMYFIKLEGMTQDYCHEELLLVPENDLHNTTEGCS